MCMKPYIVAFGKNLYSRGLFLIIPILFCSLSAVRAQRASIAFWNTENLFDTIPSLFHDDAEYTPAGARRWNTERYRTKIENLARVIDDMSADVVGLAEVENETVVRDLVMALKTDYNYIHLQSGDSRGIDLALLYKGDKFFPDRNPDPDSDSDPDDPTRSAARLVRSGTGREFLYVRGELLGEPIELIVCHMASNLNSYAYRFRNMQVLRATLESLLARNPDANIVVMGDMNAVPGEKVVRKTIGNVRSQTDFMYTPHWSNYHDGKGSYNYRGRWYLYDWMMLSPALARGDRSERIRLAEAGIYAREYLVETEQGVKRPKRTFYGNNYLGGYSDHFPVWMEVESVGR